jgi:regulatory protein
VAGRRARTGRGWDASPPGPRRRSAGSRRDRDDLAVIGRPPGDDQVTSGPTPANDQATAAGCGRSGGQPGAARPPAPAPADPYEAAREICLRQLSFRPRTRAELAAALRKRGIDDAVATAVLDRYDEVGLIDDAAFARAWVTSRHHGRGLARRALASELRQRGVDSGLVDEALGGLDQATEAATARDLVERRLRSTVGPPEVVFRRLVGMLARKGYPAGVAVGAVKDVMAARADSAGFAADLDVDALADAVDPDAAGDQDAPADPDTTREPRGPAGRGG